MKKIIILLSIIFLTIILLNPTEIINSVTFSSNICIKNLFPSLFPFLIISNILTNYGFIEICFKFSKRIMPKLFKVNPSGFYVFIMSMLSGSPSNAKYINQLMDNNYINKEEASKLLKCTHFVNPLFIISTIGITFLNNKNLGIIILISHYLGNFVNAFIWNKDIKKNTNIKFNTDNNNKFMTILTNSISDTINTLMLILGVITTCLIITTIINHILHLNPLFYGLLEITQGVKYISMSNISEFLKVIIMTFIISFGGFSIHMQVMSILEKKEIRYLPYLKARLLHAIFSSVSAIILYIIII